MDRRRWDRRRRGVRRPGGDLDARHGHTAALDTGRERGTGRHRPTGDGDDPGDEWRDGTGRHDDTDHPRDGTIGGIDRPSGDDDQTERDGSCAGAEESSSGRRHLGQLVIVDWFAARFGALGTTAVVVTTAPGALDAAQAAVQAVIADVDAACSRFRDDSELTAVNRAAGRPVPVSPILRDTVATALWAARTTGGLVDPTVGYAVRLLGYDRTFADVRRHGPPATMAVERVPGWEAVRLEADAGTVFVPRGVQLDLGATAKAWCADRAAEAAAATTGAGVLVSLGGDIAVAGPGPAGGWVIRIADRHDDAPDPSSPLVAVASGGLATSGTASRRWWRGDRLLHHIVDPSTGQPATAAWRTVSVAGATCVDANVASTAAIILGWTAPAWLDDRGLAARLVADDGTIVTTGGWPADAPAGEPSVSSGHGGRSS